VYTVFQNTSTTGFNFSQITGYDTAHYTAQVTKTANNYQVAFTPTPEPTSLVFLIGGLGMLCNRRRRQN